MKKLKLLVSVLAAVIFQVASPISFAEEVLPQTERTSKEMIIEAEEFSEMEGIIPTSVGISWFDRGDWIKYQGIDFTAGYDILDMNIACDNAYAGGDIEIRLDSPAGPIIGVHKVEGTGSWHEFEVQSSKVSQVVDGIRDLFLVGSVSNGIGNIDWLRFRKLESTEITDNSSVQLVWSDNFEYNGFPDSDKWGFDIGTGSDRGLVGWGNNELQYYTDNPGNVYVENGNLTITAKKESYNGMDYTSARLISRYKGDWKYGRLEIRAKLPLGKGTWAALWMLPTDNIYGGWPKSGEIDIMEHVGFDQGRVHGTVHTEDFNHMRGTQKGASTVVIDAADSFHVYMIEWNQEKIDFYIDDYKYFTFENTGEGPDQWPFDHPFHLLMNIAVGGNWGGAQGIDSNIWPQKMVVDYVKVYKHTEEDNSSDTDSVNDGEQQNNSNNSDNIGSSENDQNTVDNISSHQFYESSADSITTKYIDFTGAEWIDLQIKKNGGGIIGYRMSKVDDDFLKTVNGFKLDDVLDYRFLYQNDSRGQIGKEWINGYIFGTGQTDQSNDSTGEDDAGNDDTQTDNENTGEDDAGQEVVGSGGISHFTKSSDDSIAVEFKSNTDADWVDLQMRKNDGGITGYRMIKSGNIHTRTVRSFQEGDTVNYRFLYQDDSRGQIMQDWVTGYIFGDNAAVNDHVDDSGNNTDDTGQADNYTIIENSGNVLLLVDSDGYAFIKEGNEEPKIVKRFNQYGNGPVMLKRGNWKLRSAERDKEGIMRVLDANTDVVNSYAWKLDDNATWDGEDAISGIDYNNPDIIITIGAEDNSGDTEPDPIISTNYDNGIAIKLMSFNLFYANLGANYRVNGIAQTIADYEPDIASLQELWGERWRILDRVRELTGKDYALATGGQQEKYWDGDILYRKDKWEVMEDGVLLYDGSRGMTWASMKHRETGRGLLIYGIHPLAGVSEHMHLNNMEMAAEHMKGRPEYPEAPVIFMGDFNASEVSESMKLLRNGEINAYGKEWNVPVTFEDSFRLANGYLANGDTGFGSKIDYIYTEERSPKVFEVINADIRRNAPGGSDHHPIMTEVLLLNK